jgi:polysaccharide export outer membrane protein
LYIRVWHEPDLSGTVDVRPDGYISIQLIGEIKADGLTVAQLANSITKRLTEYIKTPEVNVQLLKVNSKKYSIQGEVNRPGTYPLTGPTTLLEALVNASGFRDFANTKKIYLLRGTQRFPFNYKMVSKGKELDSNIMVHTGDQIFVP